MRDSILAYDAKESAEADFSHGLLNLRAEPIAKAAQSCLVRTWHCGQHLGRGRGERLNKDELRLIAYGHVENQRG
jgi:hypothetical protein